MASIRKLPNGKWQARYRQTPGGRQYSRTTRRKVDAQLWLEEQTAPIQTGTWTDPKTARASVGERLDTWLAGYGTRRGSTVRQATVHLSLVREAFGDMRLSAVRPSHVRSWTAKLRDDGYEPSYVYALHATLAQVTSEPCMTGLSRSLRARGGPYVATTEQAWAIHVTLPAHLRTAVLLGAFMGLRVARRAVSGSPTLTSCVVSCRHACYSVPDRAAQDCVIEVADSDSEVTRIGAIGSCGCSSDPQGVDAVLTDGHVGAAARAWTLERAVRDARGTVDGVPARFRYHGPSGLLRVSADRRRRRHQGCPDSAATRFRDDNAADPHTSLAG